MATAIIAFSVIQEPTLTLLVVRITPRVLTEAMRSGDEAANARAFAAMMTGQRIDVAAIEQAVAGG